MLNIFLEALLDSAQALPWLFLIYVGIEIIEYKWGQKIRDRMRLTGKTGGPALGAVLGSLPQCGFSVIATALYSQRLLTIGTLIAVYVSTSDEAIPIILSHPEKAGLVIPIIGLKILIAIFVGYILDFIFKKTNQSVTGHIDKFSHHTCEHDHALQETACCGHDMSDRRPSWKELFWHPLIHTLKIFLFIVIISFFANWMVTSIGTGRLGQLLLGHSILQPIIAAFIGLIPNCAASVALAELFLKNVIGFGALISGLCASAGLGLLVLFKEIKNKKEVALIIGLLLMVSILAGTLTQIFYR